MNECRICGCLCDPGDMVNGICDDCRMESKEQSEREEYLAMILNHPGKQLELNLEV